MTICFVFVCVFLADIHVCLPSQFKCTNPSRCIPGIFRCNGQDNCGEGEDEKDCREFSFLLMYIYITLHEGWFKVHRPHIHAVYIQQTVGTG